MNAWVAQRLDGLGATVDQRHTIDDVCDGTVTPNGIFGDSLWKGGIDLVWHHNDYDVIVSVHPSGFGDAWWANPRTREHRSGTLRALELSVRKILATDP